MPGTTIGTAMNLGYAGTVSRTPDALIEAKQVKSDSANIPFGAPVVLNTDNTVSSAASVTLSATNFLGIAVAEVKQGTVYTIGQASTQAGVYLPSSPASILKRGDATIKCIHGTPTAGGTVYVRKALNSSFPAEAIGDFRADADGSNTVALTNACFKTNRIDTNKITEITLKSINN